MNTLSPCRPLTTATAKPQPSLRDRLRDARFRLRIWLGLLVALVASLLPGQVNWWTSLNAAKSAEMLEFERLFQVRIEGRIPELNAHEGILFNLADALRRLSYSPYPATNLTVRFVPARFWQRGATDQVNAQLNRSATYASGRITIFAGARSDGFLFRELMHELKHFQHEQVRRNRPEFDAEWEAINQPHGYRPLGQRLAALFGRNRAMAQDPTGVEESTNVDPYWWARGYLTAYAATSAEEDIAELCSIAEDREADKMMLLVLTESPARNSYLRKLQLAERHGLVPTNLVAFLINYFAAVEEIGPRADREKLAHIATNSPALANSAAYALTTASRSHWDATTRCERLEWALRLPQMDAEVTLQLAAQWEAACHVAGRLVEPSRRKELHQLRHALAVRRDFRVLADRRGVLNWSASVDWLCAD